MSHHTVRVTGRSGGVSVYIRDPLESLTIPHLPYINRDIEVCTVKVALEGSEVYIVGIYRPIDGDIENFVSCLEQIFHDLHPDRHKCFLLGDININLLIENTSIAAFKNFMCTHHFFQCITVPTRFSNIHAPSLLDHIWLNHPCNFNCGVITIDFTDHSPCFLIFKDVKGYTDDEKVKISFRLVTDEYKNVFKTKVEKYNWESIRNNDIDVNVDNFATTLNKLCCHSFPLELKYVTKNGSITNG